MSADRRLRVALLLAAAFHGPLVVAGFYRSSYDVATHEFLADHYARAPFGLWDPRWFGGFSVSSYPPLAHQLIALFGRPFGYDVGFGAVLLVTLLAFPFAVYRFAELFVPRGAAGAAAIVAVFLPAVTLTGDAFGQLPTLVALVLSLVTAREWTMFIARGGWTTLAATAVLVGLVFTAHHATALLFLPPVMIVSLAVTARRVERRTALSRAAFGAAACATVGAVAVLPLWIWALEAPRQAFIPHPSRANFVQDTDAQALFFWAMYGVLPAIALFGFISGPDRRTAILGALALGYGVIGLGGTTPVPSLLFGEQWNWLTYDRFALWCAVALLPLAGVAIDRQLRPGHTPARLAAYLTLAVLGGFAAVDSALSVLGAPPQHDLRPVADFMNADDHDRWRYQTFGFGDPAARLGVMTTATTIDGAYFTARRIPELTESGIGTIDAALWADPSGTALRRILAAADTYSIRWAFVVDPRYAAYLREAGFRSDAQLPGGIAVWEKPDAPPLSPAAARFGSIDALGLLWATAPAALGLLASAMLLARRRAARAPRGRALGPWKFPGSALRRLSFRARG
ncbi:MAG TPA: hypothetical protein VK197_09125, partial [Verrucomicrobiae bacterium]|nr:hypothetical protein [Verrucomicrobiae bacterium]